ncbi:hypothetical protein VOLCADRAFT_44254, partial [Volvox carteri f. nagariensis]
ERGVRRALHFAEVLNHEHIVQCCGLWEDEQALYIVEEYAVKGDLLQDSLSHPEKYSEAFMATKVVKPLLDVLAYLHAANVVHRAIFPEYVMFGREDKLKLGHFTSAIDQRMDPPTERIPFLDYMAPEMLSWQDHYNEKVDLWQVGCLVHEILCFSLPFETEDKLLASALILWADIVSFPDHLSPECHDFMRACLTKNPVERPSAAELLQHPWI